MKQAKHEQNSSVLLNPEPSRAGIKNAPVISQSVSGESCDRDSNQGADYG